MGAMGMAICMGAGPSVMYAPEMVEAYDQLKNQATGIWTGLNWQNSMRKEAVWLILIYLIRVL